MKISELARRTGVSKETIRFYINEGLLPKPRKLAKNMADYDEKYVDRIRLIKDLQSNRFLPLAAIKKILRKGGKSIESRSLSQLGVDYFHTAGQLMPQEIVGREAFREATDLGRWLEVMEEWNMFTPEKRNSELVYSQDDLSLGKMIVEMDAMGLGDKDGFDPELLKRFNEQFREIVVMFQNYYLKDALGRLSPKDFSARMLKAREMLARFAYLLFLKLSKEEFKRLIDQIETSE